MNQELIINSTPNEVVIALLHDKRLVELHREKNEFLGIVAHDLKNPLASIRLTADMLQRFSVKMSDAEKDERLKHISLMHIDLRESGCLSFHHQSVTRSLDHLLKFRRDFQGGLARWDRR